MTLAQVQLGKNGITENFIITVKHHFNNRRDVKIVVLKSAGHDREKMKEFLNEILEKLGDNYSGRVIGFSIFIKKWRRAVR